MVSIEELGKCMEDSLSLVVNLEHSFVQKKNGMSQRANKGGKPYFTFYQASKNPKKVELWIRDGHLSDVLRALGYPLIDRGPKGDYLNIFSLEAALKHLNILLELNKIIVELPKLLN